MDTSNNMSLGAADGLAFADIGLGSTGAAALSLSTTSRSAKLAEIGGVAGQGSTYRDRVRAGAAIAGGAARAVPGLNVAATVAGSTAMFVQAKNDQNAGVHPVESLGSMGIDYSVGVVLGSGGPLGWGSLTLYTAAGGIRGLSKYVAPLARAETCNALYGSSAVFIP